MLAFAQMAWRNVGRNKRRTSITVTTIVMGTLVVILARALLNGLQGEIIQNLTHKVNGDLQIHRDGYRDNLDSDPFDYLVPFKSDERQVLLKHEHVVALSGRLRVFGLINDQRTQKTTPVFLTGIDSKAELETCPRLVDAVKSGVLIDAAKEQSSQGSGREDLEVGDAPELDATIEDASVSTDQAKFNGLHQIMLTPSLARGLQAEIGDELVLMLKDPNNMEQALVGRFVGTIDLNLPMAASKMAWVDLKTLQDTLHLPDGVSEIAVRVDDSIDSQSDLAILTQIQKTVQTDIDTRHGKVFIVERWDQTMGFFRDVMGLQNSIFKVVLAIMFVIVSSAIVNTSMMTVSERVREIGTLMAMGYKRRHILTIFVMESTAIGVIGGVVGIGVGMTVLALLRRVGLRFSFPGTDQPFLITPFVTGGFVLFVFCVAMVSALLAALYPSYRASRLKPVEALAAT